MNEQLNCNKCIKNNDGSHIYKIKWNILSQYNITNWHLNRPYDKVRIPEIAEQLKKQNYVDGIIYLSFYKKNKIICYDGIHRIEALKYLYTNENTITNNENTITNNNTNNVFNNNINHTLIVHYYPSYNETFIKNKFESLNKCIPVPELYTISHKELNTKNLIEDIVKYYTKKYTNLFKPTSRPNIPHENRDNFTDKILYIINELELHNIIFDDFITLFCEFNNYMRDLIIKFKLSKNQIDKCNNYNCYLFIQKDWDNKFISFYRQNY